MRCILCVRSYLLLDGWTDLHETLVVYITQPGLLHGVFFHLRSQPQNRKLPFFGNRKLKISEPEVENMLDEKRMKFCTGSPILLFWYFDDGRRQRLLKIFAPYGRVYRHTRTKTILAITRVEKSKNEDRTSITKTHELSDEILFNFRSRCF